MGGTYFRGHCFTRYPRQEVPGATCLFHKKKDNSGIPRLKALSFEPEDDPCRKVYKEYFKWEQRRIDFREKQKKVL